MHMCAGELRFNGNEIGRRILPRIAGYVPQTDQHAPSESLHTCMHACMAVQVKIVDLTRLEECKHINIVRLSKYQIWVYFEAQSFRNRNARLNL